MLPFYAILVDVKDTTGKSRLQNSAQNDHEDVCVCVCVCGHTYMHRKYL